MLTLNRLSRRTARFSSRGGFTLVELLVVIGIIAILAGVALGPITNGIKQAKHNTAMQQTRQIGTLLFSYATDHNSVYPYAATGNLIAKNLIESNYVNDPNQFLVADQVGKGGVTGPGTVAAGPLATITAANMSYNFMGVGGATPAGVPSGASDLLPLVWFSQANALVPAAGGADLVLTDNCPFGKDGAAVFYKGNNAAYMKAGTTTAGTVDKLVPAAYEDTATYAEIVP